MSTITRRTTGLEVDCFAPYRMSIDQYEKLVDSGVFTKHDKAHLINGILVAKVTKKPPHVVVTELCRDALKPVLPSGWCIRTEGPVRLPPNSEPEPDVCVARGATRDYAKRHPDPADVGLLIEIAFRSLADDRKMALIYGAGGIAVYWIVNVPGRQIEVYTGRFGRPRIYKAGKTIPVVLEGVEVGRIDVVDLLP